MRIFRHPGWSMVMVGFLGLTAHGQEGAQVQNNSAPAAANAVAATANGQPILEAALQRGLKRLPPEKQAEARTEILEYLIDNVLIDQQLQQLRIDVAAKDVDARMEQIKGEIKKSNQTLEKALAKLGLTEDELRGQLTAEMRWEKYANEQITEKDVKEVFDKNPEIFDGSMVRARHILLTPPAGDAAAAEQAKQQLERDKQQIENEVAQGLAKLPATADAITRERMHEFLLDIWDQHRTTILFVTHDIEEAILLGDRVAVMGGTPPGIREVIDIPLARPRHALDPGHGPPRRPPNEIRRSEGCGQGHLCRPPPRATRGQAAADGQDCPHAAGKALGHHNGASACPYIKGSA